MRDGEDAPLRPARSRADPRKTMKRLSSRIPALILVGVALWLLVPASATAQTPYLVDTGPGGTSTIGSASLFASGSTACSPQPACASNLQYLAGQFTLGQAATISSIEL